MCKIMAPMAVIMGLGLFLITYFGGLGRVWGSLNPKPIWASTRVAPSWLWLPITLEGVGER